MSKVTIEKIYKDEKEGKYGARLQVSVKVKESTVKDINGVDLNVAGKYIRGFFPVNFEVPFSEGQETELLIIQKGEYFNFSIPGVGKAPTPDASSLVERIVKLEEQVKFLMKDVVVTEPEEELPEDPDNF